MVCSDWLLEPAGALLSTGAETLVLPVAILDERTGTAEAGTSASLLIRICCDVRPGRLPRQEPRGATEGGVLGHHRGGAGGDAPCSSRCVMQTPRTGLTCGPARRSVPRRSCSTACSRSTWNSAGPRLSGGTLTTTSTAVAEALCSDAVAGMFCAGKIGRSMCGVRAWFTASCRALRRRVIRALERLQADCVGSGPF